MVLSHRCRHTRPGNTAADHCSLPCRTADTPYGPLPR